MVLFYQGKSGEEGRLLGNEAKQVWTWEEHLREWGEPGKGGGDSLKGKTAKEPAGQ